jgi:FkbM family methyltransferase
MLQGLRRTLRGYLAKRMRLPEISVCLDGMSRRGFSPKVIFDVGAHRGEFAAEALRVWPTSRVVCFEPQELAGDGIEELRKAGLPIALHRCLLGASEREEVNLNLADTASSVLGEWHAQHEQRSYSQRTIDSMVDTHYRGCAPDFLKLDVQGYELEVLKGAVTSLPHIEAILTELNLIDIHRGGPLAHEVVDWLATNGFVAYEICGLTRRPIDGALWQIDAVFVKEDGSLRRDKRW